LLPSVYSSAPDYGFLAEFDSDSLLLAHQFAVVTSLLVEVPAKNDGPDPAKEDGREVKLEHAIRESPATALALQIGLRVRAARRAYHRAPAWQEDVEYEEDYVPGGLEDENLTSLAHKEVFRGCLVDLVPIVPI